MTIAVTGATGGLGGRVARRLAALGAGGEPLRLVGRDPSRMPDVGGTEVALASGYDDREAMAAAEVGDDVYGDDPTVNRLQDKAAEIEFDARARSQPSGKGQLNHNRQEQQNCKQPSPRET